MLGWHLRRGGHLFVDRRHPDRAGILQRWRALVSEGLSLIIYAEGTRSPDGHVARFKAGSFLLAIEAGLPIVPLAVIGTRQVMPKGRLRTEPADVRLIVHDPIQPPAIETPTVRDAKALADRVHAVVVGGEHVEVARQFAARRYNRRFASRDVRVQRSLRPAGAASASAAASPKQLLSIGGRADPRAQRPRVPRPPGDRRGRSSRCRRHSPTIRRRILRGARAKPLRIVAGGERRQDSVANAFRAADAASDVIVIHDAARPFASARSRSRARSRRRPSPARRWRRCRRATR